MEAGEDPWWLTFSGVNGSGKTMLARQVFEQAKRINPGAHENNPIWPPDWQTSGEHTYRMRRPYCLWFDERTFAGRLRGREYDLADELRDDFFVVLDELGTVRDPTSFIADKLGELAERRLNRWTMWTTNLTLAEIAERLDARITSRLIRDGNRVVRIEASDYALRRATP
jgi:DNA replication protein DnaC